MVREASDMMKPFAPWEGFFDAWTGMVTAWKVKAAAGTVIAAFCSFLDLDERIFSFLCVAIIADFIFGMADAMMRRRFRCRAVAFGATKIFWYIIYLGIIGLVNRSLSLALGMRMPFLDLFASYLIASDAVSVTGHLQSMGVPVPPLLQSIVERLRKRTEKELEKITEDKKAEESDGE